MRLLSMFTLMALVVLPTLAQESELNIGMPPNNSPEPVLSAEIWDRLNLEYFSVPIEVTSLEVDAAAAMSSLSPDLEDCAGLVPAQPSFIVQWDRAGIDENLPVSFYMQGREDTTMIVREPDGDWYCSDNFESTIHPYVSIPSLRSGTYEIWVGAKSTQSSFTGRLYVTIGTDTPDAAPPPCCDGLVFPNPAQSATDATVTYFEVDELMRDDSDTTGISLSTDILFRGESGTSFTIEVIAFDAATDAEIALDVTDDPISGCETSAYPCDVERIRSNASRRDYSSSSRRGPVIFNIPQLDPTGLGEEYYLEVVVTALEDGAEPQVVDRVRIESLAVYEQTQAVES